MSMAMNSEPIQRTFLFTDIVESTQRIQIEGLERWTALVEHHRRTVAVIVKHFGGHLCRFTGDGFLVAFDSPADGTMAALRLQHALWAQGELDVRIGVASGPATLCDDLSYMGVALHTTARLCAEAQPGEAVIEASTIARSTTDQAIPVLNPRVVDLRGFDELLDVFVSPARGALCLL